MCLHMNTRPAYNDILSGSRDLLQINHIPMTCLIESQHCYRLAALGQFARLGPLDKRVASVPNSIIRSFQANSAL